MSVSAVRWAIKQKTGDATAKSVLRMLAWHYNPEGGLCCPSLATLQDECDIKSVNTVKSALKRLVSLGLVSFEREVANGAIKRTRYALLGLAPSNIDGGSAVDGGSNIDGGVYQDLTLPSVKDCPSLRQNLTPKEKIEKEEREETTDIRPKLSDAAETVEDFGLDDANVDAPVLTLEPEDEQKADRVPVQKFVDLYNEILGAELGTCQKVTPARRQLIQARYRDICKDCKCANEQEGLFMTRKYFECVKRSDFLMGRVKQWRATFDWLIKQANYTKILEGTYNNGRR